MFVCFCVCAFVFLCVCVCLCVSVNVFFVDGVRVFATRVASLTACVAREVETRGLCVYVCVCESVRV